MLTKETSELCSYDTLYGYIYEAMAKLLQWSLQLGKYGGVIYCCTHFVTEYIVDFTWCTGPSMLPTVEDDSVLLTEHVSTRLLCRVNRGDVVIFKSPLNPDCFLCKRVVALEFDHMPDETSWRFTRMRQYVPRGHVWVEGDNRRNSMDSRCFGPIPVGLIRGRAIYKVWPVRSVGLLPER